VYQVQVYAVLYCVLLVVLSMQDAAIIGLRAARLKLGLDLSSYMGHCYLGVRDYHRFFSPVLEVVGSIIAVIVAGWKELFSKITLCEPLGCDLPVSWSQLHQYSCMLEVLLLLLLYPMPRI
jgi:hypothetical protein